MYLGRSGAGRWATGSEQIPMYNHLPLTNPAAVGSHLLKNGEGFSNDHTGVHQWYRWSIAPNNANRTNGIFVFSAGTMTRRHRRPAASPTRPRRCRGRPRARLCGEVGPAVLHHVGRLIDDSHVNDNSTTSTGPLAWSDPSNVPAHPSPMA
jgi:hypothetical protein